MINIRKKENRKIKQAVTTFFASCIRHVKERAACRPDHVAVPTGSNVGTQIAPLYAVVASIFYKSPGIYPKKAEDVKIIV
jgi:hypothetical protein